MASPMRKLIVTAALMLAANSAALAGSYEDALRAAGMGDARTLQSLLERGIDPDTSDENGNSLLILAARDGHADAVAVLLKSRARSLRRNLAGDTALMLAALKGHEAVVRKFIEAKAPLDSEGWNPLLYAAFEGHAGIVRDLLAAGAAVDARAPNLATPLMLAARNGHIEVVRLLLDAGADSSLRNDRDVDARTWALENSNTDIADLISRKSSAGSGRR